MSEKIRKKNNKLNDEEKPALSTEFEKSQINHLLTGKPVTPDNRLSYTTSTVEEVKEQPPKEPADIPRKKNTLAKKPYTTLKESVPNPNPPRHCGDIS